VVSSETTLSDDAVAALMPLAHRLADEAAGVTLAHFRTPALVADDKRGGGRYDPVTEADRGAEAAIRAVLATERPDDGVFGEEEAARESRSGLTWVIDPIDGTRAFISGLPVWGTLIALDDGWGGRIGLVDQPFTGERFCGTWGPGGGAAWLAHRSRRQALAVRPCAGLAEASLFTTDPHLFEGAEADAFHAVRGGVRLMRYGVDCYAYAMLAMGQVDLVIETGLGAYDIAAHIPIIRAAGGIVTDWQGGDCRWGGRVVAAGDARTHAAALEVLSAVG